jgi:hypothetical protein
VVHDVPDVFDIDAVAELTLQFVADELQRFAEAGGGRAVAAHADLDWLAHAGFLYTDATIWPSAAGMVGSSKIWRTPQ